MDLKFDVIYFIYTKETEVGLTKVYSELIEKVPLFNKLPKNENDLNILKERLIDCDSTLKFFQLYFENVNENNIKELLDDMNQNVDELKEITIDVTDMYRNINLFLLLYLYVYIQCCTIIFL